MKNVPFSARLQLHNAQVELEALRCEGRGMLWENERCLQMKKRAIYCENAFNELAIRIRATKLDIEDITVDAHARSHISIFHQSDTTLEAFEAKNGEIGVVARDSNEQP